MGQDARVELKRVNLAGALGYLIGPLALVIERNDARVRFHAMQGLLLAAVVGVFDLSLKVVEAVVYRGSWEGGLQATAALWWVYCGEIILWMVMLYFGAELAELSLPGVGRWAKKLAGESDAKPGQ
jgi:uncharacterized membrane protein